MCPSTLSRTDQEYIKVNYTHTGRRASLPAILPGLDRSTYSPFILIVTVLSIAGVGLTQNALAEPLALCLSSAKVHELDGENITLALTIENRSAKDIVLNKRMANPGPDLMIDIEDLRGNRVRWIPPAPPPRITREDFTVLSAGQKLVMPISILQIGLADKLKREQKYRMTARYQNTETGSQFNYAAWTGSITSNTILFEWGG